MDDTTTISARVWLCMLAQGGLWTANELGDELKHDHCKLAGHLTNMAARGFLVKHEKTETVRRIRFSVDKRCKVPSAVLVQQLLDAGIAA